MDEKDVESVSAWLASRGLAGDSEVALLHGFCERCLDAGLELSRGMALIDTLHPVHEGRVFYWDRDKTIAAPIVEYGPSDPGRTSGGWEESPFFHLLQSGDQRDAPSSRDRRGDRLSHHRPVAAGRADRLHRA